MTKTPLAKFICTALLALTCLGVSQAQSTEESSDRVLAQNAWEGFLPIQQGGRWGYIDRSGTVVIKPQFDSAERFADGLALVRVSPQKKPKKPGEETPGLVDAARFIDQDGKVVIQLDHPLYLAGESFSDGLTTYWTYEAGKGTVHGYIDRSGKIQIKAQFTYALPFVDGLAGVCIEQKCGFIDKAGEFVIEPKYRANRRFSEGLALATFDHNLVGFINKSGEMVIEPQFGFLAPTVFREGLSAVAYPHGKYGYINTQGAIVIPMQYEMAQPFSEGLAAVRVNSKWGFIDKTGKLVIEPQFASVGPFSEGLAPVGANMMSTSRMDREDESHPSGFIDKQGKLVLSLRFDTTFGFVNGIAKVHFDTNWGYIDKTGKYIWQTSN
jgi:hypothetical protein